MSGEVVPLPVRSNKDLGRTPAARIAAMNFLVEGGEGEGGCPGCETLCCRKKIRPQIFKINEMN